MTSIQIALQNVAAANERLYKAIRETYPIGCECIAKKTDRGPGVVVEVLSWSNEGRLRVINRETGNSYEVNGESSNLKRRPTV